MRNLLIALPLTLLPLAALAGDAHVHGVARLDVALAGNDLEIELGTPAINLAGFEHAPRQAPDQAVAVTVRRQLEKPQALLGLECDLQGMELDGTLVANDVNAAATVDDEAHPDVSAMYHLNCSSAPAGLDLIKLFRQFPGIEKVEGQVVGPNGQKAHTLSKTASKLTF